MAPSASSCKSHRFNPNLRSVRPVCGGYESLEDVCRGIGSFDLAERFVLSDSEGGLRRRTIPISWSLTISDTWALSINLHQRKILLPRENIKKKYYLSQLESARCHWHCLNLRPRRRRPIWPHLLLPIDPHRVRLSLPSSLPLHTVLDPSKHKLNREKEEVDRWQSTFMGCSVTLTTVRIGGLSRINFL
jgi:hypothetical protein